MLRVRLSLCANPAVPTINVPIAAFSALAIPVTLKLLSIVVNPSIVN